MIGVDRRERKRRALERRALMRGRREAHRLGLDVRRVRASASSTGAWCAWIEDTHPILYLRSFEGLAHPDRISLSPRASRRFAEIMASPPEPSERLIRLMAERGRRLRQLEGLPLGPSPEQAEA